MKLTAAAAALCLAFAAHAHAGTTAQAAREARMISGANVSLPQAVRTCENKGNGRAISATFDTLHGNEGTYIVTVLSNDGERVKRFDVNAYTGQVDEEWSTSFKSAFPQLTQESMRNPGRSLDDALTSAEQRAGGTATSATIETGGSRPEYTVTVARTDGSVQRVQIAADGTVAAGGSPASG